MTGLSEEVRLIFDLAALRQEAERNLRADDWNAFRTINDRHADRRRLIEQDYERSQGERVAQVRQRLIDEAGGKPLDLVPRWVGRDRFNKGLIDRQARLEVLQAHRSDLARIDREEAHELQTLLERAGQRGEAREKPLREFARATDRRSGPDRRMRRN